MADDVEMHAVIFDGIVKNRDTPITISINKPDNAKNVAIGLFEVDEWTEGQANITEPGDTGLLDIVAIFKGDIVDKKFIVDLNSVRQGTGQYALKIRFEGDPCTYECHVSEDPGENESDTLEIVLGMSGEINGKKISYQSKSPLFVRNIEDKRPSSVFFTNGGERTFFTTARIYWNSSDRKIDTRHPGERDQRLVSQEEIFNFLPRTTTGPWDTVNIVGHGMKFANRTDGSNTDFCVLRAVLFDGYTYEHHFAYITATLLRDHRSNERVAKKPDESVLDRNSRIVFRGCQIGTDQSLLDELRWFYGNRATVYAPKYLQVYEPERPGESVNDHAHPNPYVERFIESFFVFTPGTACPTEPRCLELLKGKYSGRNIPDNEWISMLRNSRLRRDNPNPPLTIRLQYKDRHPPRTYDFTPDRVAAFNNLSEEDRFYSKSDDWSWRQLDPWAPDREEYRFEGRRWRIDVRRYLRDSRGDLVQPELKNPDHYGRSPAW